MIVHEVEQNSPEWFALRNGKPTASEFKRIVTPTGKESAQLKGYALTLAAEILSGGEIERWEGNGFTERGKELEDAALRAYEFQTDVELSRVGFVTDDQERWGCSPDALAGDGLIEVKCQKAENHLKSVLTIKDRKIPNDYIPQIQGQLFVTGAKWCDLIFHHPTLPPGRIRVEPDMQYQELLRNQLDQLMKERDRIIERLK